MYDDVSSEEEEPPKKQVMNIFISILIISHVARILRWVHV